MVSDTVIDRLLDAVRTGVRPDLSAADVDDVVNRWPSFQSARLIAAVLHHDEGRSRENVARDAAIRVPDRSRLFFIDEVLSRRPDVATPTEQSPSAPTEEVSEEAVEEAVAPDEPPSEPVRDAADSPADHVVQEAESKDLERDGEAEEITDFLSWLRTKRSVSAPGEAPGDEAPDATPDHEATEDIHEPVSATEVGMMLESERSSARLDDFLEDQIARKRRRPESSAPDDGPVSETLAQILAAQGKWPEAIAMYERLAAKHPEKSRFFADRIAEIRTKSTD